MTQPKHLNIAYPANQLTQRYYAARALQSKEIVFYMSDGRDVKGFITGLDDDAVQVCAGDEMKASLLYIPHIIQVVETGNTIDTMPKEMQEDLRRFTRIFRRVAENELARPQDKDTDD